MHPARIPVDTLLSQCDVERTRRGGPGGQHRNKVSSAIVITHRPTAISGQASERRSQHANRDVAVHRLRVNLAIHFRLAPDPESPDPESPDPDSPDPDSKVQACSELWQSRNKGGRIKINPAHEDFPAILAEAMGSIARLEFNVSAAAEELGVSTSQLVKLLKLEPVALTLVNSERQKREMGRLK